MSMLTLNSSDKSRFPEIIETPDTMSFNRGFFNTTIQALLAGLVVLIIVLKRMKSPRKSGNRKKQLPLPPGPAGWPVIGSIPEMLKNRPVFRWLLTLMKQYNTEIACIRLGNTHVIPVTCPVIAREMFKQQDAIFASRPLSFAQSILSNGYKTCVITPFGDQFKKMRKVVMTEIVCPARHRWLNDKRAEEADHLTAWVHNLVGKSTPVDFRFVTRHYCGNVIKRLMFGKRYFGESAPEGGPGKDDVRHMEAMFDGLGYTFAFCVSDYIPALTGLDLNGHEKIMREACATMDEYHDPIVDERIKMWGEGKRDEIQDFLDVFISLKDKDGNPLLTADEIKPEIKELVMAAPDNPSNAVEWAMAEMMNKPEILQKAVEEIDTVVGKHRLVTESDIPKLNYVKACLREAFRLHPVAAFNLPHVALSDTTVAGKYSIPEGSHVLLSRYGLGRNPKTWSDPLQFKPERHLSECSEVTLTENDLRFISFGTGRRGCAAPALGTAITVMLFARLLQGFTWRLPEATRVELVESGHDLFLAKPLVMLGEPRLPDHLYPKVKQN